MTSKDRVERAIWNIKLTQEEKEIINEIMLYKHLLDLDLGNEVSKILRCDLREVLMALMDKWCVTSSLN